MLFVNVRGFTALAEQLQPSEVAARLNRFDDLASRAIFRYDGTLDKLEVADYTVLGDTVNVVARLQGEAAPGEILISQETNARIAGKFPHAPRRELRLKGKSDSVIAWQVGTPSAPKKPR